MKINSSLIEAVMNSLFVAKKTFEALPPLPPGIKPIYHRVLNLLYLNKEQEKEFRVSELSVAMDMQLPNMTKIINEMTDAGLVQKVRSNQDKRAVFIQITEEGIDYFINHVLVYRKRLQEEFEDIDEEDCYTMIRMIHTIQKKIQKAYDRNGEM
ncbi:MarR family transcriptional regulator [Lysinibacillus endophyticus]|uniref:MarR family winged helix-turn-helix transcriptional regulator n=1 Tax=Ureibacillus endophyticus TaxID=1978490 RepID=UPI0031372888